MRKLLSSLVVLATILLIIGCHKDELYSIHSKDGDVLLTVNLSTASNSTLSRATQASIEEQKINNAYIFVFNSGGGVVYSKFHSFLPIKDKVITVDEQDVVSGSNMTIAVVANIDNQIMDASESTFADVATLEDLESLSTKMLDIPHPLQRSSSFLMSGKKDLVTLSTTATNSVDIPLVRTDAKIKFNISVNGDVYSNIQFTPTEWRVGSYPRKVKIFDTASESEIANENLAENYGTYTAWANFEQSGTTITTSTDPATFSFYGVENILSAGTIPNTGTSNEQYALREKQVKNADGTNQEKFEYAPDGATFVEFKGAVLYTSETGETIADVIFRVQLGGINKDGAMAVNDFNTYRNTGYTYNITIKGVDDIDVEVENNDIDDSEEPRPGAEGEIVVANSIIELDAYNNIFSTTFNIAVIDKTLRWDVSTIFSNGGRYDSAKDYKWIHFKISGKTKNAYNGNYRVYSGDGDLYTEELDLVSNPSAVDTFIAKYINDIDAGNDKLLDVDQLVEVLKRCKERLVAAEENGTTDNTLFDKNGNIIFTVYVKENYYDYNVNSSSTTFEPMLWQKFVNTDKRVLNILSKYQESLDKESSRLAAQISFRQATIQTMYNTESGSGNFSGFGSQFYPKSSPNGDAETDFSNSAKEVAIGWVNNMKNATDKDNGRANCLNFIKVGDRWDKYINTATWSLKNDYNYPLFKFLLYNRDIDGDGKIDADEIQWYMASINQLIDLWIGEDSFNPAAKLYFHTNWELEKQHYASSTIDLTSKISDGNTGPNDVNVSVLWSSEGSSVGALFTSYTNPEELYYRIVRNFGMENSSTLAPDKIYTYTTNAGVVSEVEFSRLNTKSIRNNITGELPEHELRDPAGNNKVPRKFAISPTFYSRKGTGVYQVVTGTNNEYNTWAQINGEDGSNVIELPDNWRIPNQRELSIMYSIIEHNGTNWPLTGHFCRTGFCDAWEGTTGRPGFSVSSSGNTLALLKDSQVVYGGVRPVKDIQ